MEKRGIVEGRREDKDKVGVEGGEKGEQGRKCGKIKELWKEGERELWDTVGVGWGGGGLVPQHVGKNAQKCIL